MPDSNTPASRMIRVPTPLIDSVRELSTLHRAGHTRAVLAGLQQLISRVDSESDSSINVDSPRAADSSIASKLDSEMIAKLIAEMIAPIQAQLEEHIEQRIRQVAQSELLGECSA